jgi:SDR family mycofactocin-dependent oxidoreductase
MSQNDRPEANDTRDVKEPSRRAVMAVGVTALAGMAAACTAQPPISAAVAPAVPQAAAPRGRLERRVVLVTGAARGIGRAISLAAAREGADVVALDLAAAASPAIRYPAATPADLQTTEQLVTSLGRRCLTITADVRSSRALADAVQQTVSQFGQLDVLVANAGIMIPVAITELNDQNWQDVIDVNLTGVANSIRAVIPHMTQRQQGRIIAIGSIEGRMGTPFAPNYNASKWGVIGLIKTAALELGPKNITANVVSPTAVNTVLLRNPAQYAAMTPDALPKPPPESAVAAAARKLHPLRVPWIEPEDVAATVIFLASDEARYISGASFDVTAGIGAMYTA